MIQPMINQIAPIDYRSIGRGRWQEEDEREKEEEQRRRRRRRRGFRYIARQGMIKLRHLSILNMMEHSWAPGARKREAFVAFLLCNFNIIPTRHVIYIATLLGDSRGTLAD